MLLSVQNVRKHFNGAQALAGVFLSLRAGERLGVVGPNGSGKSTLEGCIGGSIYPDEGHIEFLGRDVTKMPPEERSKLGVARVFQLPQFLPREPVALNVWMGLYRTTPWPRRFANKDISQLAPVREILEFVGLIDDADRPANKLSYFALRKMEVARALVSGPRLLLLDELTSGLNSGQRAEFESLLVQLRDVAVVLVEHEWEVIRGLCERVLIMEAGSVVADRPATTLNYDDELREIFGRSAHAARR